jgi:hypothetical protein
MVPKHVSLHLFSMQDTVNLLDPDDSPTSPSYTSRPILLSKYFSHYRQPLQRRSTLSPQLVQLPYESFLVQNHLWEEMQNLESLALLGIVEMLVIQLGPVL